MTSRYLNQHFLRPFYSIFEGSLIILVQKPRDQTFIQPLIWTSVTQYLKTYPSAATVTPKKEEIAKNDAPSTDSAASQKADIEDSTAKPGAAGGFTFGGTGGAAASGGGGFSFGTPTQAAKTTESSGFSFGSTTTTSGFGLAKPATTTAVDTKPANTFGGFSFTTTPTIKKEETKAGENILYINISFMEGGWSTKLQAVNVFPVIIQALKKFT